MDETMELTAIDPEIQLALKTLVRQEKEVKLWMVQDISRGCGQPRRSWPRSRLWTPAPK